MNGDKEEINHRYINNLEVHRENSLKSMRYSSDRFDILVVSISTTALAVTIGSIRNFIGDSVNVDTCLLKLSWLFFVLTIIFNLGSQITAYYSHKNEAKIAKNLIRQERKKDSKGDQNDLERKHKRWNCGTQWLNILSFITLCTGIIIIVIFYSKNV